MNSRTINLAMTLPMFALLVTLAGCGGKQAERERSREREDRQQRQARREPSRPLEWQIDRPEPTTMRAESQPLAVEVKPTLVKQGPAPLVYIVESPGSVAVVDLNTQQRLASAPVAARTIVRVEARSGVIFGEQRLLPGPLPNDHQYGIYLESDSANETRNQTVGPAPRAPRQGQQPVPTPQQEPARNP